MEEVDDLITQAQDSFFDGNLAAVIDTCEKVLQLNPKENDAFELLTLALLQMQPPRYSKASQVCLDWSIKCFPSSKQMKTLMRAAYHSDDRENLIAATNQLTSMTQCTFTFVFLNCS